jgi:hypothetical protein
MIKEWQELTEKQQQQVLGMFDQRYSDTPDQYTYEIGITGSVLSRKHK